MFLNLNLVNRYETKWQPKLVNISIKQFEHELGRATNMVKSFWRYGHFHNADLRLMHTKYMTRDLPKINITHDVCSACQMEKIHRQSFPSFTESQREIRIGSHRPLWTYEHRIIEWR